MFKKNGKVLEKKYDVTLDGDEVRCIEQQRLLEVLEYWECKIENDYMHSREEMKEFTNEWGISRARYIEEVEKKNEIKQLLKHYEENNEMNP